MTTDIPCRQDAEEMGCLVAVAGDVIDLSNKLVQLMSNPAIRNATAKSAKKKIVSYLELAEMYRDL